MTTIIEFENVSKRFMLHKDRQDTIQGRFAGMLRPRAQGEEFWALRDISFSVGKGESLGLVGHNGAGKSTALKLMTRILEPTSGAVKLRGRVAALLELGSGFHPDLSGRENVFLNGSLMGFSKRDMQARLEEIVEFSEVGDEGFQRKCMERIYRFRQMGRTIIFVSHALETVRLLCDHAIWLDHGAARASGPASEVIDSYLEDVNRHEAEARRKVVEAVPVEDEELQLWRHGTGEVEICAVDLLDASGRPQELFYTGEPLTVRMSYDAHIRVERPQFGLALYHASGTHLSGPNNNFAGSPIASIAGRGTVDYTIPELPLLPGQYRITTAIHDSTGMITYDHHEQHYSFMVRSHSPHPGYGLVEIPARWRHWPGE